MPDAQSYAHHTRWDPPFHFFVMPVFGIAVIWSIVRAFRHFQLHPVGSILLVILMIAALIAVLKTRLNALKVQDRVIRLEERLRLSALLPDRLRARINELTEAQLIGLRFASDAELPALAERALNEKLSNADIKKSIKNWRPDNFRV